LELVVSIAISSLLLALSIPAVQAARAAAQKSACLNQLRQIAIACQNYESTWAMFPSSEWPRELANHLEIRQELYGQPTSLFACPSDRSHANGDAYHRSYAINGELTKLKNVAPFGTDPEHRRTQEIPDGLSNTASFGEVLSHPWYAPLVVDWEFLEHDWNRAFRRVPHESYGISDFVTLCKATSGTPWGSWLQSSRYRHAMPPNSHSCWAGSNHGVPPRGDAERERIDGARTAGSVHRGGTHVMNCDGSGKLIADTIALEVWWALGTRSGGEILTDF
jgi:YD repeat-containing protein